MEQSLELVSSDDLITELASRNKEIINIREYKKTKNCDGIFVKTGFGDLAKDGVNFDLMVAVIMLHAAQLQLTEDFLKQGVR